MPASKSVTARLLELENRLYETNRRANGLMRRIDGLEQELLGSVQEEDEEPLPTKHDRELDEEELNDSDDESVTVVVAAIWDGETPHKGTKVPPPLYLRRHFVKAHGWQKYWTKDEDEAKPFTAATLTSARTIAMNYIEDYDEDIPPGREITYLQVEMDEDDSGNLEMK